MIDTWTLSLPGAAVNWCLFPRADTALSLDTWERIWGSPRYSGTCTGAHTCTWRRSSWSQTSTCSWSPSWSRCWCTGTRAGRSRSPRWAGWRNQIRSNKWVPTCTAPSSPCTSPRGSARWSCRGRRLSSLRSWRIRFDLELKWLKDMTGRYNIGLKPPESD